MNTIQQQEVSAVERLIVGCGDTALSLWIEEHSERHADPIRLGTLPEVLMIGKDLGSWGCDYTLAQRYAMLERRAAPHQPAEFVTQETYNENRHVNARHLYQANLLSLVDTNAPALHTNIIRIERNEPKKFDSKKR